MKTLSSGDIIKFGTLPGIYFLCIIFKYQKIWQKFQMF